jgi:hypothetical protein
MRSSQTLAKAIQRQRNIHKGYPKKAKKYEDLVNIPDRLSVTADGQPFVLLNGTVIPEDPIPNVKRILIFISPFGRGMLSGCCSWYVDGTFKPASETHFYQIVFMVGLTGLGKAVPCLYALLPKKEKTTYIRLA